MFPLSVDYSGEIEEVTYLPSDDFNEDWGGTKLIELNKYLMQDTRTEEGRLFIARFIHVEDKW